MSDSMSAFYESKPLLADGGSAPKTVAHGGLVSFRSNVSATFMRQLLVAGLGILAVSLVSRSLGGEGYGKYALAVLSIQGALAVFSLSVPSIVVFYAERCRQSGSLAHLFGTAVVLQSGALLVLTALTALAWFMDLSAIRSLGAGSICVLGTLLVVQMSNMTLEAFLLGLRRYHLYNGCQLTLSLMYLAGLLWFLPPESSWQKVLFIQTLSAAVVFPFYIFSAKRLGLGKPSFSSQNLKEALRYGRHMWASNLISLANYRVQYILVEALFGLRTLGQYALLTQIMEKLWLPGQAIATILFPERAASREIDKNLVRRQGLKITAVNMILVFSGTLAVYGFLTCFDSKLFGTDFDRLTLLLLGLMSGIIAWAGVKILAAELAGSGRSQANALISLCSLCVGSLGLWLGSAFGSIGGAVGVSAGYTSGFILALILFLKMTETRPCGA